MLVPTGQLGRKYLGLLTDPPQARCVQKVLSRVNTDQAVNNVYTEIVVLVATISETEVLPDL